MDRDTMRVCTLHAGRGHGVLIIMPDLRGVLDTFRALDRHLPRDLARIRSNYGHRISWPNGGTIRIITARQNTRGLSYDVVVHPHLIADQYERAALTMDAMLTVP